jgi:hypothetical protein
MTERLRLTGWLRGQRTNAFGRFNELPRRPMPVHESSLADPIAQLYTRRVLREDLAPYQY